MLDLDARQITLRTKPIGLSRLECLAIAALFEAQGQVVGAEALFAAVWPHAAFSTMNLRALIARLRQKLEPGCIETIGREGYAWVGRAATPVSRIRH
jgi:DNA-binding response OmpR family regulator